MSEDNKAQKMIDDIIEYIYEEGEDKVTNSEVLRIIESVKQAFVQELVVKEDKE